MLEYDLDFEEDFEVPSGTDLLLAYEWQPLDLTGCTASFVSDFGTIAATVAVTFSGADAVSQISVQVPNTTTSTLVAGTLYAWKVLVTFPTSPATVLQLGHGEITVA